MICSTDSIITDNLNYPRRCKGVWGGLQPLPRGTSLSAFHLWSGQIGCGGYTDRWPWHAQCHTPGHTPCHTPGHTPSPTQGNTPENSGWDDVSKRAWCTVWIWCRKRPSSRSGTWRGKKVQIDTIMQCLSSFFKHSQCKICCSDQFGASIFLFE